jgi:hypothetical protein
MRANFAALLGVCLAACGSRGGNQIIDDSPSSASGGEANQESDNSGGHGSGEMAPPIKIATGAPTLVGVTGDGWAIYRDADSLAAAKVAEGSEIQSISDRPGSTLIRGNVVFNWADMDWTLGVGDLSVWTADTGAHEIGLTPYVEGLVAASADGSTLVFTQNTRDTTADLMIAGSDMANPSLLIESIGLGSQETCGASLGFVGEQLFVGWCKPGSRAGMIERFDRDGDAWNASVIAEDALPAWSASSDGARVFYQSSDYAGYFAEAGTRTLIDAGVSQGQIAADGSSVLYTVGDQLRRTALPDVMPVPVVTTGYKQPVAFSPNFDLALYSTTVTYDNGTERDLWLATTDGFDEEPLELVHGPTATLGRSSMSRDGQFVFFLTDVSATGGTLHVVRKDGTETLSLPGVVDVAAGAGSTLFFSDNSSDPEAYPVVADLKMVDLAAAAKPTLVEASVLGPKNFELAADGQSVIYVRSGQSDAASDEAGLYFRASSGASN